MGPLSYYYSFDFNSNIFHLQTTFVLGQTSYLKRTYVNQKLGLQFQYPSSWGEAIDSDSSDCNKFTCSISFIIRDPFSRSIDLFIIQIDVFNSMAAVQESCDCKTLAILYDGIIIKSSRQTMTLLF